MLQDFINLDLFPLSANDILINLLVAVICGLLISYVYRLTYRGPSYSTSFAHALVLLSMITAIVILVIGNNLARAFGLVGAMSIIRFRTAVRDTQDIVFIFFSLSIGMAAGVGLTWLAILGTIFISLVIIILVSTHFVSPQKRQYLLQISYQSSPQKELELSQILQKYCRQLKLVNLKSLGYNDELEAFYHINFKRKTTSEEMVMALNKLTAVKHINLYFDEDDANAPVQ